ncbi:YSIRK-type signal peptide-containing protein, partial [Granulicatella sp.]
MVSKNNHYLNQQKSGRKFEKYSIKKLKVGAASVLVGAGFFFGYHVEASEVTKAESVVNANNEALGDKKINTQATVESTPNKENSVTEQPVVTGVVEEKKVETTISQAAGTQAVQTLQTT